MTTSWCRAAAARSARTRSIAARSTPAWVRSAAPSAVGGQAPARGRAGGRPRCRRRSTGRPTPASRVRMCSPARSSRPEREAEPDRRVVVAAGEHHLRAGVDEPGHGLGEQRDGLGRGHRPVVDVAGDQHRVDPLGADDLDEVVEVGRLGVEQPHPVERPSQVPVGGVDQAHASRLRSAVRQRPGPHPASRARGRTCLAGLHTTGVGPSGGDTGPGRPAWVTRSQGPATPASSASATARRSASASTCSSRCSSQRSFDFERADDRPGDRAQPRRRRPASRAWPTPRCCEAIADPDYQTELGRYNIELNVPPRPLPGDAALELEDDAARQPQPRRGAGQRGRRAHRHDRHPADADARALRAPSG